MTDLDKLAKSLTKAQREALCTQPHDGHHAVWGDAGLYCVAPRMQTYNALYYKGLIHIGASDTVAHLTDLGLALRNHLKGQNDG